MTRIPARTSIFRTLGVHSMGDLDDGWGPVTIEKVERRYRSYRRQEASRMGRPLATPCREHSHRYRVTSDRGQRLYPACQYLPKFIWGRLPETMTSGRVVLRLKFRDLDDLMEERKEDAS